MIGVLGGGFGLFAWMPALAQFYPNETILMESRHKEKFNLRPELQQYKDRIKWTTTKKLFNESELLIIAIPPDKVFNYLSLINQSLSIKRIIIEKPICEDPDKSERFISVVEQKGIKMCSSYLFFYTKWYEELQKWLHSLNNQYNLILIQWMLKTPHIKETWKEQEELGGGVIKFYGIHLISVLSHLGYKLDNIQKNTKNEFFAEFCHKIPETFPNIIINVVINAEDNLFMLRNRNKEKSILLKTPFGEENNLENDNRIPYLIKLLNDFSYMSLITKKTNQLWKEIEQKLN